MTPLRVALVCLFAGPSAGAHATGAGHRVTVKAGLDRNTVPLNRSAILTLRVEWEGETGEVEVEEPSEPEATELEIKAGESSNVVTTRQGKVLSAKLYSYVLSPSKIGVVEIAPLTVTYRESGSEQPHSLRTPGLRLEVTESVHEGLSHRIRSGLLAFSAVALLTLLIAAVSRARRASREAPEGEAEGALTPSDQVLAELDNHKALRIAGDFRGYCEAVASTLRDHLSATFAVRARELSTDQLLARLAERGERPELIEQVGLVLNRCDAVKFAGASAQPAELDALQETVKEIAQSTAVAAGGDDGDGIDDG